MPEKCPTCGMPVRIIYRKDGAADHYEPVRSLTGGDLPVQDEVTAELLRRARAGKKTVAFVGMAETSCTLAPFKETGVEIWGLNEMHAFPWMVRADRWFQIHNTYKREVAKRGVRGHYEWLQENKWGIPIYMQHITQEVPNSREYPLHEVCDLFFKNFRRGDAKVKYFTSSFAYYMGVALLEKFERIEIYGFEMSGDVEYVKQKACAEFWIGMAMGMGVEIYTPSNCQLLFSPLYGGNEQGDGW
jgi:hypothetical protein